MEEELGSKLVERSGKYLEVTEAGKALYKYAFTGHSLMEEAKMKEVKRSRKWCNGRLTLGINTFSYVGLSYYSARFPTIIPKVTYKIQQNESSHLCKLVRDRSVALAIIRLPLELDDFTVFSS